MRIQNSQGKHEKFVMENCQVEELKKQLLASQQKLEELTKEHVNLQQKVEELTMENEEQKQDFEGHIAQLQKEKDEILKEVGIELAEEEEQQIMLPMPMHEHEHEMKVQLPLENWYDLLEFVPRRQLGNISSQIGDRQFAQILQSFLHEHGDITLGLMWILAPRDKVPSDPIMVLCSRDGTTDLPDWPMPENVKNFEDIFMDYVDIDMSFLDFLRSFQENSLFTNVNLELFNFKDMLPTLNKIIPLISSINSIHFYDNWLDNNDEEFQLLLKTVVAQARILSIKWDSYRYGVNPTWEYTLDWFCFWLYTPRDDGMPRALVTEHTLAETRCSSLIGRIKKDFEEANHAVSFFIRFILPENFQQEISLNNNKTNEKLVLKAGVYENERTWLLISRHSSKAAKHKIEEDEKEILQWDYYKEARRIRINH